MGIVVAALFIAILAADRAYQDAALGAPISKARLDGFLMGAAASAVLSLTFLRPTEASGFISYFGVVAGTIIGLALVSGVSAFGATLAVRKRSARR